MTTNVIVSNVSGMKKSIQKYHQGQEKVKAWRKITNKLLNWEE
jgi:hypothetical protein